MMARHVQIRKHGNGNGRSTRPFRCSHQYRQEGKQAARVNLLPRPANGGSLFPPYNPSISAVSGLPARGVVAMTASGGSAVPLSRRASTRSSAAYTYGSSGR